MEWIRALADQIFLWLKDLGYLGILIGLMIEIIPSEIVLAYGGFLVSKGTVTFAGVVLFGTIGGTLAQIFLYWIGKYGGRPFLEKYGKYLLIHQKHLALSEKWFQQYGTGIIFTARFVPVVRHAISIPAGIVHMPFWKFTLLTTLAVIPWSILFITLGKVLGENWHQIDAIAEHYALPITLIALITTLIYLFYQSRKQRKQHKSNGIWSDKRRNSRSRSRGNIVAQQLRKIGENYRVFYHVYIQAGHSGQMFEHLVIGPQGVFHIYAIDEGKRLCINQLYRHEYVLKHWLRQHQLQAPVTGVICLNQSERPGDKGNSVFPVLMPNQLLPYITSYLGQRTLTQQEVARIAALIKHGNDKSSFPG